MWDSNAETPSTNSWLIYAMGGGWGHLVRALALGRLVADRKQVTVLCNSPYSADLLLYAAGDDHQPIVAGCYLEAIPHTLSATETRDRVREAIAHSTDDLLIVDTFPQGLGGELADLLPQMNATPRILVHRDLNPEGVRAQNLHRFVADNFDLIAIPGEPRDLPFAELPQVEYTAPWLIRSASELGDRTHSLKLLRLNPAETDRLVLVLAAGRDEELRLYGQLTVALAKALPGVTVRCLSPDRPPECPLELWTFHWPGIECLPAADVVVGGGGYNTFYECAAVGVPLVAFAFPRQYDRQAHRVLTATGSATLVNAIDSAIAATIALLETPRKRQPPTFVNGAVQAADLICDRFADP